jgi:hypothetical protein
MPCPCRARRHRPRRKHSPGARRRLSARLRGLDYNNETPATPTNEFISYDTSVGTSTTCGRPGDDDAKTKSTKKPPMPNKYSKLPAADLDALVAYMQSLK